MRWAAAVALSAALVAPAEAQEFAFNASTAAAATDATGGQAPTPASGSDAAPAVLQSPPELASDERPAASDPRPGSGVTVMTGGMDRGAALVVDPRPVSSPPHAHRFEVVAQSVLHRDAFATAARVGPVVRGQLVTYLDFIDRRLRIFNTLIFDGGFWIKVRAADGAEGWLPATVLRAVQ